VCERERERDRETERETERERERVWVKEDRESKRYRETLEGKGEAEEREGKSCDSSLIFKSSLRAFFNTCLHVMPSLQDMYIPS
jgi:hypothetical protein